MALPVVKTALDCSDFSKTVIPFLHQLAPLPGLIFESITDSAALKQLYLDTNPLISAFAFSLALFPIFLIVSEINKNYSQVDRLWSILPSVYNAHFATYAHLMGFDTKRLDTLLAASCLWSARLTFNYWRKGGYTIGSEDYRWEVLRTKISPPLFFIFNVIFISLAQSILLLSITTPTYLLLLLSRLSSSTIPSSPIESWTFSDLVITRIMVAFVMMSFFADQQQWQYQTAKKEYQATAKVPPKFQRDDLDRGFIVTGLWSWSRHPNFVAEQAFWLTLYQYSCYLTNSTYNWTVVGGLAYILLFQASTWFTELITAGKYPEYEEYRARVGKFLPRLGTGPQAGWKTVEKKLEKPVQRVSDEVEEDTAHARERYNLR